MTLEFQWISNADMVRLHGRLLTEVDLNVSHPRGKPLPRRQCVTRNQRSPSRIEECGSGVAASLGDIPLEWVGTSAEWANQTVYVTRTSGRGEGEGGPCRSG